MNDDAINDERSADEATTLIGTLDELAADGYDGQFIPSDDATLRCTECSTSSPATQVHVDGYRRLEGASDPDDMNIVVWAACPSCGRRAVATIGFGPNSSPADGAVLSELDLDDVDDAGHTDAEG